MMFVLAVSALAGLCIAFLIGEDAPSSRPRSASAPAGAEPNAADDMARALRKAIEGGDAR